MAGKGNNWISFHMERYIIQRAALRNKDYICLFERRVFHWCLSSTSLVGALILK